MKPIHALTGARFFAAFWVVLYHFVQVRGAPAWLNAFFLQGGKGVEFFFILSGFVLTYNYAPQAARQGMATKFWRARLARIAPAYWLALVVSVPLFIRFLKVDLHLEGGRLAGQGAIIGVFAPFFAQAFVPFQPVAHGWNTPAWSVSVEAFFYALFPFLIPRMRRFNKAACLALLAACLAIVAFFDQALIPALPVRASWWGLEGELLWKIHPVYNLPFFLMGCSAGRLFLLVRDRLPSGAMSILSVLSAAMIFVYFSGLAVIESRAAVISSGLFTLLIFSLAFEAGPLAAMLASPTMVLLGDASYSLYIFQAPVKVYWQQAWSKVLGLADTGSLPFQVSVCVACVAFSILIYKFIEVPAREFIKSGSRVRGEARFQKAS